MATYTQQEIKEHRKWYASLNEAQKDWIKHKCNWEHMTVLAVCNEYRGYIESLANPQSTASPTEGGDK